MRRGIETFRGSVAICAQYGAARMAISLRGVGPTVPGCRQIGADGRPPPAEWHQASGRRGRPGGAAPAAPPHAFAQRLARRLPGWIHDDGFDAGRPDIDAEEPGEGPVDQKKPRTAKAIVRLRWMNERNMSGSTI